METYPDCIIYTDGASRGNPGPAAYAFTITILGVVSYQESKYIGTATNNIAEYTAILKALEDPIVGIVTNEYPNITVFSDSMLVVNQINGTYKVKSPELAEYHEKIVNLIKKCSNFQIKHVNRSNIHISACDKLCNQTLNNNPKTWTKNLDEVEEKKVTLTLTIPEVYDLIQLTTTSPLLNQKLKRLINL